MPLKIEYVPFADARTFARSLHLAKWADWTKYCRNNKAALRAARVPANPQQFYKAEFTSVYDFLGTVAPPPYLPWAEALERVQAQHFTSRRKYFAALDDGSLVGCPREPRHIYPEFKANGGWIPYLGTAGVPPPRPAGPRPVCIAPRPYAEAEAFVHTLPLEHRRTETTYKAYARQENLGAQGIPINPSRVVSYQGLFKSWEQWLGFWRTYEQHQAYAFDNGLNSLEKWQRHLRKHKPLGMYMNPQAGFEAKGCWTNLYDFFNKPGQRVDRKAERIASAQKLLSTMKEFANAGLSFNKIPHSLVRLFAPTSALRDAIRAAYRVPRMSDALDLLPSDPEFMARFEALTESEIDAVGEENESLPVNVDAPGATSVREPSIEAVHAADFVEESQQEQAIAIGLNEFRLALLSGKTVNEGMPKLRILIESNPEGPIFRQMRATMLTEIEALKAIQCAEWQMKKKGVPQQPNVMQLYAALRIRDEGKFGNWSTFGSGKTAAAGLASYIINSQLTVVIAANSNIAQWKKELAGNEEQEGDFRGANVVLMDEDFNTSKVKRGRGQFLVINYEKFGGADSRDLVDFIISKRPDLLVFDEVQLTKYRSGVESKRRRAIMSMRLQLRDAGVKVLVQTGTPVINQLSEGESILELMLGVEDLEMNTRSTPINAIEMYYEFFKHGLRATPPSPVKVNYIPRVVVRDELFPKLPRTTEDYLDFEKVLLDAKLEAVRNDIRKGVIIYSNFVEFEKFADRIQKYVEDLGFTCGQYTGPEGRKGRNENQKKFMDGDIDVLLASQSLSLGVDGLQEVCDQLIFMNLPWTAAEYGQTIGRIARQGSNFTEVNIITPIIDFTGVPMSWDRFRESALKSKRDLGHCVTDGEWPLTDNFDPRILVRAVVQQLEDLRAKQPELIEA